MQPPETEAERPVAALDELAADLSSRKRFLKALGTSAAAGAFAAVLSACGEKKIKLTRGGSNPFTAAGLGTDQYGKGDLGIARFALTLEFIAADFYAGATKSGKLTGRAADLARRFGAQEHQHVTAVEAAVRKLGGTPPLRPKPNFKLDNQHDILVSALDLETLGVAAILGSLDRIVSKELLALALSMHSVEGRHTVAIAQLLGQPPTPQGAFAEPAFANNVFNQLHSLTA